jgi:hypothetical protein
MIRRLIGRERARNDAAVGARRGAVRARWGGARPVGRGGPGMSRLSALPGGHAGGVRGGRLQRAGGIRRRAAGRPGGPLRPPLRRSRWTDLGQRTRGRRHCQKPDLCDECREALQVPTRRGWKTSDPSISEPDRDSRVPTLVGGRVARARPRRARVPGSDCRQGGARTVLQSDRAAGDPTAEPTRVVSRRLGGCRNGSSVSCAALPGSRTTYMGDWSRTSGSSPQNWHDFGSSPGQRGILTGVQRSNRASIAPMAAAVIRAR